jgi:hypothetical protein
MSMFTQRAGTRTSESNSNSYRARGGASARRPKFVPALQTPEGKAAYDAIVARKQAARARRRKIGMVIGCSVLVAAIAAAGMNKELEYVFFGVVALLFIVLIASGSVAWSEADYYSVPGSRDDDGEHRCIHCGGRGIYRHGEYKSVSKYADCSKCKKNLWQYAE